MKYIKPKSILLKDMGEKKWVEVYFGNDEKLIWVPALADLAEMLYKIGICEDEKYHWPENKGVKGAEMVIEYIKDAILGIDIKELNKKYNLPTAP